MMEPVILYERFLSMLFYIWILSMFVSLDLVSAVEIVYCFLVYLVLRFNGISFTSLSFTPFLVFPPLPCPSSKTEQYLF